ncbi:putative Zinc finger CCCH domain-containing protein 45 [Cocos nucifera]|uniref:Putative Zinc finger CCCH domain-containing protein 45 n=1 Tax=Cocos nucifera TaxID=13894 RepID=A0A8K0I116_COCNU|nr:putative Zinc finger CCCH domain-containing protein 45 [Cocos nucifera]
MDDADGALSFDFEGGLDAGAPVHASSAPASLMPSDPTVAAANAGAAAAPGPGDSAAGGGPGRRTFRQTVCRHWLRSLCMKGDACGFLHQYDKSRMPVCRFFRLYGECREQDCVYKHTNEDIKECNMYKLGFCPNGPDCRYRHAKLPGPPPPVEEVLQKIQHLSSFNYGSSNRFFQHRNTGYNQQAEKAQFAQGSAVSNQNAAVKPPTSVEPPNVQQPQSQIQQSQQQPPQPTTENPVQNISNGLLNQATRTASPLPQGQSRFVWSF